MSVAPEFRSAPTEMVVSDDLAKAKRLLKSAVKAAETLAEDVAELIRMRAWEVMGYPNFSDMWEAETGFKCPRQVQVLAGVAVIGNREIHNRTGIAPSGKVTRKEIAETIGFTGNPSSDNAYATHLVNQVNAGVPSGKIILSDIGRVRDNIGAYGTRARPQPRNLGAGENDLVQIGFQIRRGDADAITEIARKAAVPNAEIYRQAVAEFLARVGGTFQIGAEAEGGDR